MEKAYAANSDLLNLLVRPNSAKWGMNYWHLDAWRNIGMSAYACGSTGPNISINSARAHRSCRFQPTARVG
jgi:hypothetical protein